MTIILSNLNRFKNVSLEDSLVNLQLNGHEKSHRTLHMLLHYLVKRFIAESASEKIVKIGEYLVKLHART